MEGRVPEASAFLRREAKGTLRYCEVRKTPNNSSFTDHFFGVLVPFYELHLRDLG